MSRGATDVLRRGFELTLANWPLLLIRVAEQVIGMIIMIGALVAAVIPIAVSAGLGEPMRGLSTAAMAPEELLETRGW